MADLPSIEVEDINVPPGPMTQKRLDLERIRLDVLRSHAHFLQNRTELVHRKAEVDEQITAYQNDEASIHDLKMFVNLAAERDNNMMRHLDECARKQSEFYDRLDEYMKEENLR